jgi:hypothetical protein
VDVDAMMQTMQADARFQFPKSEAPVDPDLARAVITFGDALTRGDSGKIRDLMDGQTKYVLDELVGTEQWSNATEGIEAVRVIFLGGASGSSGGDQYATMSPEDAGERLADLTQQWLEDNADQIQQLVGQLGTPEAMTAIQAGDLEKIREIAPSMQLDPEIVEIQRAMVARGKDDTTEMTRAFFIAMGAPPDDKLIETSVDAAMEQYEAKAGSGSIDVAYAVQDPSGAYVVGWSLEEAYDNFVFGMAPVTGEVRRWASDWDGSTNWDLAPSFASMMHGTRGTARTVGADAGAGDDESDESTPEDSGPTRKSTPRGPVTIPGG